MILYRRPESVLVVVYTAGGLVLLLQRADLPDFWQSVTGTLELDESPADAALRELLEETGIDDAALVDCRQTNRFRILPNWAPRYAPGTTHNKEHVFSARIEAPVPIVLNPDEHLAFEWLPATAAITRCSSITNQAAVEQLLPSN